MKNKYHDTSRRKTPWDNLDDLTPSQELISNHYLKSYEQKHPSISDDTEARFFNSFHLTCCKYCGSSNIKKNGFTKNGIQRYKCLDCKHTFSVLTNTLFNDHKVSITERSNSA
jgi:transposase-like protein